VSFDTPAGGGRDYYQRPGADGPQRRLLGLSLAFFPMGRRSAGAFSSRISHG